MSPSSARCHHLAISAAALLLLPLLIGITSGGVEASTPHALRETCQANIVETLPSVLGYTQQVVETNNPTVYQSILDMINRAQRTIKITSWYIALSRPEWMQRDDNVLEPGKKIMEALEAAARRGVKLTAIVGRRYEESEDVKRLAQIGQVHHLDHDTSLGLDSELQSKFILVDEENFYIGSTNLVWTSFTLNKSIGITFTKCKSLARDLNKIFQTYILLAESNGKPSIHLPERWDTIFNLQHPMNITVQDHTYRMFLSGSPAIMNNETSRTSDLDALLHLIDNAQEFIYVSVPDYSEKFSYTEPRSYWPVISNAIKKAAFERGVRVRLLLDSSICDRGDRMMWIKSLAALYQPNGAIMPRLFRFPEEDVYGRYKNDDYVLTDRGLYLGAGSWMPDYFSKYATISVIVEPTSTKKKALLNQVEQIFWRDYYSRHSTSIDNNSQ